LLTKLCKFDGQKTALLSVRDFLQISGRAGRKGFDDKGTVVVMAPEHVIENHMLEAKAGGDPKKLRKVKRKQPPQKGYVHWDKHTFEKVVSSNPETLRSSFQVSHGMLLNVLSRPGNGCLAMRHLIRDCHESDVIKERLRRQGFKLFRSLVERDIVTILPKPDQLLRKVQVNVQLQEEFSIFQELAIWLLDTIPHLAADQEDYALDLLTLVESICENPRTILRAQLDKLKGEAVAEMKAKGMEYEERMDRSVYHFNSWIGRSGIERTFDRVLRGEDGGRQLEVNAKGVPIRMLSEKKPIPGKDVHLTIDIKLEEKLRGLLGDKKGAIWIGTNGKGLYQYYNN